MRQYYFIIGDYVYSNIKNKDIIFCFKISYFHIISKVTK